MSPNSLGKMLVLFQFAFSVFGLAWAVAIYMQFVDWGWKEPRGELWDKNAKSYGYRVPSELDKRLAQMREALRARDSQYQTVVPAQNKVREIEGHFPTQHLFYRDQLAKLYSSKDEIDVPEIVTKDGVPELDTPGKTFGKPLLANPDPDLKKSWTVLKEELKAIYAKIEETNKEIDQTILLSKKITTAMNGLNDETGEKERPGLYDLIQTETATQSAIKYEAENIRQSRIDALKNAEIYRERELKLREDLEARQRNQKK